MHNPSGLCDMFHFAVKNKIKNKMQNVALKLKYCYCFQCFTVTSSA